MAFYDKVPGKKEKTRYDDLGSWDEEGSHYGRSGEGGTGRRSSSRREESFGQRKSSRGSGYSSYGRASAGDRKRTGDFNGRRDSSRENQGRGFEQSRSYGQDRGSGQGRGFEQSRSYGQDRISGQGRSYGQSRGFDQDRRFEDKYGRDDRDRRFEDKYGRDDRERRFGDKYSRDDREKRELNERDPGYREFEFRPIKAEEETGARDDGNILCGRNPIREALRGDRDIEKILVQKGSISGSARDIVQMAREKKIMVQEVEKSRLDEIAPHHQGLVAFASAYEYSQVEDILRLAEERKEAPFIILLDGVTDPHNLGAVIRTAECAGAHGVIVPLHRSVGLTPAAVKASAGAVEHIPVARVTNLNRTLEDLKKKGIWIYAVTMEGKDYSKVDFHDGTALVIGAEGEGISRLTLEKCDMAVSLPMKGHIDSLNASVAAGIVMYRVLASRK